MLDVLSGFAIIIIVMVIGFGVGRKRLLGPNAVYTLNMYVFWIALPMLLIDFLSTAELNQLFGTNFFVVALSTLGAGFLGYLSYRLLSKGSAGDGIVAMLASSYCNATHLGIPLMLHLLGNPTATLPVVMFQVGFYGPLSVLLLDLNTGENPSRGIIRDLVLSIVRNPLVLGAFSGIVVAFAKQNSGWELPNLISEPIHMIASSTVAVALVAFGMSMADVKVLEKGKSPVRAVYISSAIKTIVHPVLAWVLGAFVFGANEELLVAMVLIAALPTGQNVFTYAQRFNTSTTLARDAVVVSTILALPSMGILAVLLA